MGIVETYKINPFAAVSIELEVKVILFPISWLSFMNHAYDVAPLWIRNYPE
jgi:hypothetical protein